MWNGITSPVEKIKPPLLGVHGYLHTDETNSCCLWPLNMINNLELQNVVLGNRESWQKSNVLVLHT
jgi:hypothetical protein